MNNGVNNHHIVRYAEWVIRWRWLILIGTFAFVLAAVSGARLLQFSTDYRMFFSKDNPQLLAFEALQSTFTKNDNILFVLAPQDGKVFTRKTLTTVEWLTKQSWQIPFSSRVDSITNFQYTRAKGDDLVVSDLIENANSFSDADLKRVQKIALAEPLLLNRLLPPTSHVTGVNVTIVLAGKSFNEVPSIVAKARALAKEAEAHDPNIKVYLTGITMMNNAFTEVSKKDQVNLMPIMYGIVILILGALLRSPLATLATLVVIGMATATAMGLTGWLGIKLSPPTMSAPTIILTLAIADSVHFLVTMFSEMRQGKSRHNAIIESLRVNLGPIFLTSVTTAIGFMSMNFSDAPPFRDLGNITAIGVMAAFVYSIMFLPAVMSLLPLRQRKTHTFGSRAMERFADFVVARRKLLFRSMAVVIVVLIAFIPRNELNDEFVKYFDESVPFRAHTDFAVENLTGIYLIEYRLDSGEAGGISKPAFLKQVAAFSDWYRQQPRVIHVNTLTDIMKRLNKNMHGDNQRYYRLPERRDLSAQYLLLYEMSLPFGLDLNNQIDVEKRSTRMTVTLENMSSKELLKLEDRAQQWLKTHTPNMYTKGASPSIMFAFIGDRNIRSMLIGSALALVLISILIILAMRSLKIGLISLVPNLLPAAMAFGLWGLLVGQVGLSLSIVAAMTLGIVVDDTIHFLSKYLRARREQGLSAEDGVRYAFHTVGTALWVNSVILICGFTVLIFSVFELNSGMGKMSAITITMALAADFLFLPPLLMMLERKRNEKTGSDPTSDPALT